MATPVTERGRPPEPADKQPEPARSSPTSIAEGLQTHIESKQAAAREWLGSRDAADLGLGISGLALEFALVHWWLSALSFSGHPGFPAPGQDPLIWLVGEGDLGIVRLIRMLAVVFLPYLLALGFAQRARGRYALIIAFGGACIFGATMLAMFPAGALDIFHNIMDGRLVWLYHINPTIYPPSAAAGDPLFSYMHYWADTKTAYGPLWFLVTLPAFLLAGNDLTANMVAYKALPFAFEIASLALIALIAQRIDPRRTVAAVVCFGWNPLVLWEVAGNGHNDIVMMCFVLAAILLLLTNRWPWAFPLLACSIMVKYISAVLLPVFVLWVLLRHGRRSVVPMITGLLGALVVALVIALPFWAGPKTLAPLFGQEQDFIFSPASALIRQWGENIPATPLVAGVKRALTLAFATLYVIALARMRRSPAALVRVSVEVLLLLLIFMTWWFWPWYVVWGLALAALLPSSRHARVFVIFSVSVMFVYISSPWRLSLWNFNSFFPLALGTSLVIFLPPVLYALMYVLDSAMSGPDLAGNSTPREAQLP